ncbi:hypothetical protein A3F06_03280 [candidate division TM6 bacterium RIFCSPHIGHO2_12_FULL_36_22]|nr:MAG: hypothetical protein A3F06_03280 [candidate division TM6 bacterium RIFCSPHIGHO2_12_FULL_36_22]
MLIRYKFLILCVGFLLNNDVLGRNRMCMYRQYDSPSTFVSDAAGYSSILLLGTMVASLILESTGGMKRLKKTLREYAKRVEAMEQIIASENENQILLQKKVSDRDVLLSRLQQQNRVND